MKIFVIIGTRPEAIKFGPVIQCLQRSSHMQTEVVSTAQHREMLDPMLDLFGVAPAYDLDLMRPNQSLPELTARALARLSELFLAERPGMVLVQGDTSTVLAAGLAAFYAGIPAGHVEAGLRSDDLRQPFPEEMNRRVTTIVARLHFAPTERARRRLLSEAVPESHIFLTGNTIVDAVRLLRPELERVDLPVEIRQNRPLVLVTAHRRENHGEPLERICRALIEISRRYPDTQIVYPVHLNPAVDGPVRQTLFRAQGITLLPPQPYPVLLGLMNKARLILTDSGGIQEEASAFGKPVLILREVTERPEVVESGFGELVGTQTEAIISHAAAWLDDPARCESLRTRACPFGDGRASERIVTAIEEFTSGPDANANRRGR